MEHTSYQDNLEQILAFTEGRQLLSVTDVGRFTGLRDPRTVKRRFPHFVENRISAATLARCLSGGAQT